MIIAFVIVAIMILFRVFGVVLSLYANQPLE